MSEAMLYGTLYFAGIALAAALSAVIVQALFLSLGAQLGARLLACVPLIALGAGSLGIALSKRDLQLNQLYGGVSAEGAGALWVTRAANLVLLAIALALLTKALFTPRKEKFVVTTAAQRARRRLFLAFLAYAFCSLILPMIFGTRPSFSHEGLAAVPMFAAAYFARKEPIDRFMAFTRWALLLVMVTSLAAVAVMPKLVVSKYLTGLIPGVPYRFWGLTPHPNYMGALAISLMLVLWLYPFPRRWLNVGAWLASSVALFLTQSKTNWLAGMVVVGALLVFKHGRDTQGRLRMGIWISLLLGTAVLASGFLFIDFGAVFERFAATDEGGGLTTLTGRTRIWEVAIQMWLDSPFFGYGPEAWAPLHRAQLGVPFATQAHNQLLEALSTGGLFYAVPMLIYFVLLGGASFRSAEQTRGVSAALFLVIAVRCISEAPFIVGNMTGGDSVLHLLLFMIVTSEAPVLNASPSLPFARRIGSQARQDAWARG